MGSGKKSNRIMLPDIPQDQWSDFRVDFENGISLKDIASKHHCDPRTVKAALPRNRGSADFGKWAFPKKLEAHMDSSSRVIDSSPPFRTLTNLSHHITAEIQKEGYTGGERTVRNYLNTKPEIKALLEKQQQKSKEDSYDQH